jgi:hypothetical protein
MILCANASTATAPGTPVARPDTTASPERDRSAVGLQEHGRNRLRRSGFASVVDRQLAAGRLVMIDEGAAAEAGALRLDQRQHRLDGDCGIDSASAAVQHLEARLGGERVGGDDERLALQPASLDLGGCRPGAVAQPRRTMVAAEAAILRSKFMVSRA